MDPLFLFWLIVWAVVGGLVFLCNLNNSNGWSKKQWVFAVFMGGPAIWILSCVVAVVACFIWVWEHLK